MACYTYGVGCGQLDTRGQTCLTARRRDDRAIERTDSRRIFRATAHMAAAWPSAACLVAGLFQLEWVTFLLVIELPHKLDEHMLQVRQPLPAPILQVLKVILEGGEPFFHGGALFHE